MLQKTIKKKINVVRSRSFVHSFIYKILERKLNKKKEKKKELKTNELILNKIQFL